LLLRVRDPLTQITQHIHQLSDVAVMKREPGLGFQVDAEYRTAIAKAARVTNYVLVF
jgi:hypothetical protein